MRGRVHKGRTARLAVAALALLTAVVAPARADVPAHGRAWELVSAGPTNSVHMALVLAWSDDGDRVVYATLGPMPGASSGDLSAIALGTRGPGGWTKQPIAQPWTSPAFDLRASQPQALDASFGTWVWRSTQPLLPGAPQNALYRRAPDGTLTLLGTIGGIGQTAFVAASADTQHAVFQSTEHLLPADAARVAGKDAYEFAGDELRLVGVDSAGAPLSACGSAVGNGEPTDAEPTHPVSTDGERIFFSAPASADCGEPVRVYVREHGAQTVEASASACDRPDCSEPADVRFAGAARDGSAAFLITPQQLTDDDVDAVSDLYRFDVATHALTRLSAGPPGAEADVGGALVAMSDDGARVYFVATGALVPGAGVPGIPNLYLSDHGTLRFVAAAPDVELRNSAISTDGRILAFTTATPLAPGDTDASVDVYRYDEQDGTLVDVSLGVDGRGNEEIEMGFVPGGPVPLRQGGMRYMTADGRRVVFFSAESLVPEDTSVGPDVYEWVDGRLGLITSGAGDQTVAYEGISADGRSIFFFTDETLTTADRNGGDEDLYVARLGGGFPDPPSPPPPCDGDACQGPPARRLHRPVPPTLLHAELPMPLGIRPLGANARQRLAATGRATVVVDAPAAGRISLVVRAGIHGRRAVVARGTATARGAGAVRLHVRLRRPARRLLQQGRPLRLTLAVRQAHQDATAKRTVRLTGTT